MKITGFAIQGDDLILHATHKEALKFAQSNDPFRPGEFDIRRVGKKRSLDANSYMWVLCGKIADAVGITKEEVYRRNIPATSWCLHITVPAYTILGRCHC